MPVRSIYNTCPYCGNEVPAEELFCDKCGMRVHESTSPMDHHYMKRSLRSSYYFVKEQDYMNCENAIKNTNYEIYKKIEWYGKSGAYGLPQSYAWIVNLYDEMTQQEIEWTVRHIREHGGRYLQR